MRILTSTLLAAVLAVAVPAHAHDGPKRHDHGYHHGHHYKHHRHAHHRHHYRPHPHAWGPRREVNNYYYGGPVVSAVPGIHVIFPDIFVPWQ